MAGSKWRGCCEESEAYTDLARWVADRFNEVSAVPHDLLSSPDAERPLHHFGVSSMEREMVLLEVEARYRVVLNTELVESVSSLDDAIHFCHLAMARSD